MQRVIQCLAALGFVLLTHLAAAQGHLPPYATLAEMSIPTPWTGWDTTVTAEYGSDTFATHWFDNTVACTDTSNPNGSQGNPRCTPPTMSSLAAGSVVQGCGTYSRGSSDIVISASGTAADPVFFRKYTGCATLRFNFTGGGNFTCGGTYLFVEGVITNSQDGTACTSASNFVWRDNEHIGTGSTTDSGACMSVAGGTDVVRMRSIVRDCGDWLAPTPNDSNGFAVGSSLTRLWDLWNTCYHVSGDCWGSGHDANHTTFDIYLGGNDFYSMMENPVDLKEVHNVIISRNYFHDVTTGPDSDGDAIVIHYGPTVGQGPYNTWVINNVMENVVLGVVFSDAETSGGLHHHVIGNVIRNCSVGIMHDSSSSAGVTFHFKHNTIGNCGVGILVGSTATGFEVGGNIIREASDRHFAADTTDTRDVTNVFNELYYDADGGIQIGWGAAGTTYTSIADAIANTADWDNSLQTDPLMTDYAGGDYTPTATSPGLNVGLNMSSLNTTFNGLFGTTILYDAAGNARPDGVWDMGAYEYDGSDPPPPPPTAPLRLRIR